MKLAALLVCLFALPATAQDKAQAKKAAADRDVDPKAVDQAIRRGLEYLAVKAYAVGSSDLVGHPAGCA